MNRDSSSANLGDIASNCHHISMFLSYENWKEIIPRIQKFIDQTWEIYNHTEIDKSNKLFKDFEKLLGKKIGNRNAQKFYYYYLKFHKLSKKIASSRQRADSQ